MSFSPPDTLRANTQNHSDKASIKLSSRELEVLQLLIEGYTNLEIARNLHLSHSTIKSHLRSIFNKLNVDHRVQAAVAALQHGLVASPKM